MLAAVTVVMALAAAAFARGGPLFVLTWVYPVGTLVASVHCLMAGRAAQRTGVVPARELRRTFALAIVWELAAGLVVAIVLGLETGSLPLTAEIYIVAAMMAFVLNTGRAALRPGTVTPPA